MPPTSPTRTPRPVLVGILLAWTLATAVPLAAQAPAPRAEVKHVRFQGVRSLPEDLLEGLIETGATHCRSWLLAPLCALDVAGAQRRTRLDSAAVARDTTVIRRLYADWGYPEAHATSEVLPAGPGRVTVLFRVVEGAPTLVRSIRVEGLEGTGVTTPGLPIRVGSPYAPVQLEAAQRAILGALGAAGHPFSQVEVSGNVPPGGHQADVVLHVTPGPVAVFGRTTVDVRPPLQPSVVLRRVAWREGQRFDPAALARTEERLRRVPVVDSVRIVPAPGAVDSSVDVAVAARAGRIAAVQGAGSLSSTACLSGESWWSDRYLFGRPRVVTLAAGASNLLVSNLRGFPCSSAGTGQFADPDYFLRGDWREPVGADSWLLLTAGYSRQSAPGAYIQRGVDGRLGLERDIRPGLEVVVAYAPSRMASTAGAPFFCALFGACAAERLSALEAATTISPLTLDIAWAPPVHARQAPGPRLGALAAVLATPGSSWLYASRLALAGAARPTGSSVRFARGEAQGNVTRLVGRRFELAGRLRAGALASFGDTVPPQLRLFGGGPDGVRGAPQNLLGPRFLVADSAQPAALGCAPGAQGCAGRRVTDDRLLRAAGGTLLLETGAEARVWVSAGVQLAAFADYGYVRTGALAGAPEGAAPGEAMLSPGIGVRFLTPVGPLRLDFAYDPTGSVSYPLLARQPDGTFLNMGEVAYDPYGGRGGGALTRLRRRLRLQFSLGQPL